MSGEVSVLCDHVARPISFYAAAGGVALWTMPAHMAHGAAIRRLCWTQRRDSGSDREDSKSGTQLCLASCGEDHMVRIFEVHCM